MPKADGSIIIDTRIDTKGFQSGSVNLQSQFSKLAGAAKKLSLALGGAFVLGKIVQFGKEAIELGSDLQEVQNVVDVTFGSLSGQIDEFAKNAITSFGLSELSAKQYASTIGAMLKSMGFATDQAAAMSMEIAGLAGDMASFYNLTGDDAFAKIRSGISGETEPLKQLGINLSVANLEQYALAQGITKTYNAMTEQEKALLRYNYLLSVTSDAQGDFARTSNSWANQTKILSEQFNSLKATIGQGLINVLTPVIKVINTILSGLQAIANAFRQFTELLFGAAGGTAGQIEDVAAGFESAAGGASDLAAGTEKAGKAAKKYLAGFDEITKLGGDGGSGGSGGGGGAGGEGIPIEAESEIKDTVSPKFQAIADKIQSLLAPLREIDFTPAIDAFGRLGEAAGRLGGTIGEGLAWAWNNILVPLAEWTIEEIVPAVVGLLADAMEAMDAVLQKLAPVAEEFWTNFLQPLASWTADAIVDAINGVSDAFSGLFNLLSENKDSITTFATILGSLAASAGIIAAVAGIAAAIKDVLLLSQGAQIAMSPLTATVLGWVGQIKMLFMSVAGWLTGTLVPAITAALGGVASALGISVGWVVAIVAAVAAAIAAIIIYWDEIVEATGKAWESIKKVWGVVTGYFSVLWTAVTAAASKAWEEIKEFFSPAVEWFSELIGNIYQTFSDIFYNIGVIASGCWEIIKAVWGIVSDWFNQNVITPVSDFFSNLWDGFISGASDAWEGIKEVFGKVADFFKEVFSDAWEKVCEVFSPFGEIFTNIKDGILTAFKEIVNGLIRGLNSAISVPFDGINWALSKIRDVNILGLAPFSNIRSISVPQIPYLAQGAVIPPNAPFMAVLGDQSHGTNVEAPLSTIQEAVAVVMEDMLQGQMAGFEAVVEILREILEAIYGIEIGDEVIAKAARRYQQKLALAKGR